MNIASFDIKITLAYLKKHALVLTPYESSHSAAVVSIFQTFNNSVFGETASLMFDTAGEIAKNPLSYIPPCVENQGREFLRVHPAGLVKKVGSTKKSWYHIARTNTGVVYSPGNKKLGGIDALVWGAAHEVRHKIQKTRQLFTPQTNESKRAFLGVALDVLKMHLKDYPGHYGQSGENNVGNEFDAEVIGMYIANLWRLKTLEEIKQMLLAEPA